MGQSTLRRDKTGTVQEKWMMYVPTDRNQKWKGLVDGTSERGLVILQKGEAERSLCPMTVEHTAGKKETIRCNIGTLSHFAKSLPVFMQGHLTWSNNA